MRYNVVTDFPRFPEVIQQLSGLEKKDVDQKLIDSMDWSKPLNQIPSIYDNSGATMSGGVESKPQLSEKDILLGSCESYSNDLQGGYRWKNSVDTGGGSKGLTDAQIHNNFIQEADGWDDNCSSGNGQGMSFIEQVLANKKSNSIGNPELLFG